MVLVETLCSPLYDRIKKEKNKNREFRLVDIIINAELYDYEVH